MNHPIRRVNIWLSKFLNRLMKIHFIHVNAFGSKHLIAYPRGKTLFQFVRRGRPCWQSRTLTQGWSSKLPIVIYGIWHTVYDIRQKNDDWLLLTIKVFAKRVFSLSRKKNFQFGRFGWKYFWTDLKNSKNLASNRSKIHHWKYEPRHVRIQGNYNLQIPIVVTSSLLAFANFFRWEKSDFGWGFSRFVHKSDFYIEIVVVYWHDRIVEMTRKKQTHKMPSKHHNRKLLRRGFNFLIVIYSF